MVDVLLLELEGVIVHTEAIRRAALAGVLASAGISLDDDDWVDAAAGCAMSIAVPAVLARHGAPADPTGADLLALRAERDFAQSLHGGAPLRQGARALLAAAEGRTRIAAVTRLGRREADLVLALAGVEHAFETIIASEDVLDPKPSPEGYEKALARLARRRPVRRERCLALEDGRPGIRAARAARVRCLAVGTISPEQAMEADGYLGSLEGATLAGLAQLAAGGRERVE